MVALLADLSDVSYFNRYQAINKAIHPMSDEKTDILPAQCRAARALLDWSRDDLAERAQAARSTLADFEAGKRSPHPRTLAAIRAALEAAGVEFIPENGGGVGVRLRRIEG